MPSCAKKKCTDAFPIDATQRVPKQHSRDNKRNNPEQYGFDTRPRPLSVKRIAHRGGELGAGLLEPMRATTMHRGAEDSSSLAAIHLV